MQTYEGRVILDCWEYDRKPENRKKKKLFDRFLLCRKLIEYFSSQGKHKLTKDELDFTATGIVNLLTGEIKITYFQKSLVDKDGNKLSARGCLYEIYRGARRLGRELGYIPKKNKRVGTQAIVPVVTVSQTNSLLEQVQSDTVKEIDTDYEELWENSRQERRTFFNEKVLEEILNCIRALQLPNGYVLMLRDYDILHQIPNSLTIDWPKTYKQILAYGRSKKTIESFISRFPRPLTSGAEQNIAILTLPLLLINLRGKKGVDKDDKPLVYKTFAVHLEDIGKLPDFRNELKDLYSKHSLKEQPFIGICGPIDGTDCFVNFFEHTYSCTSLVEAVDICFRSVYGLAKYFSGFPLSVWEFFERHIYKIENPHIHSGVLTLISNLKDY